MTVLYNRLAVVFVVFANACGADTAGSIAPDLGPDAMVVNPDAPAFVSPDLGRDLAILPDVAVIPDATTPDAPLPSPDAPSPDSYVAGCGNGIMDTGEACDEGEGNDNLTPNACRTDCVLPRCGDGVVDSSEMCEGFVGMSCPTSCNTEGMAVCQPETCVLGACIPPEDICNSVDDDCNGVADNWFACAAGTVEDCAPTCGERGSRSCSDSCAWGACVATDTNCNDGDPCTVNDHCAGDVCAAEPIACVSPSSAVCANATTRRTYAAVGTCDVDGECSYTPTDTVCNDGNACTTDACSGSDCITSPIICDDNNLCTNDSCDSATGCVFTPNVVVCNDDNACTSGDECGGGACSGVPVVCTTPLANECLDGATLRTYAADGTCVDGVCSYTPTDTVCDDADACTTDSCVAGVCAFTPIACVSPAPAVCANVTMRRTYAAVGSCSGGECSYTPTDTVCNDGDACTTDSCSAGVCTASVITCADNNLCTNDSCDSANGCVFTANTVACDDGNACTSADVCDGGSCTGAPVICASPPSTVCADGTALRTYAAIGSCSDGVCSYASTDTVCNDADACTTDACAIDICAYTPVACTTPPPATCVAGPTVRTYSSPGTCTSGSCNGGYPFTDTACPVRANATTTCSGAVCGFLCLAGYANCDGAVDNGCETSVAANNESCGPACTVCTNTIQYCVFNACAWCSGGWSDCNDSAVDACEINVTSDVRNCGICGNVCTAPANGVVTCASGACGFTCNTGYERCGSECCAVGVWTATNIWSPGRVAHTAVWTGLEMIVWGGQTVGTGYLNTGGRYDPLLNNWSPTPSLSAPSARRYHSAVWTGSEMLIWGGNTFDAWGGETNSGSPYDPSVDLWGLMTIAGAPSIREFHSAVWTGSRMIVWGGSSDAGGRTNTGSLYDPIGDVWLATTTSGAPTARSSHTVVWAEEAGRMIIWGGNDGSNRTNTGARYDPVVNAWATTTTSSAPSAREGHTAVWTGSEMIVWGGWMFSGMTDTGGRYDPLANVWTEVSTTNVPTARSRHTAVWTGSEMIVWGGCVDGSCLTLRNTGGRYDPSADTWDPMTTRGAPTSRIRHTVVWTGSEMIVWGGFDGTTWVNTGGRYTPP